MKRHLLLTCFALASALVALTPAAALAHPLGNFTINRYAGLLVQPDAVSIDYVIDMAEIPAYQEIVQVDPNATTSLSTPEGAAYRASKCAEFPQNYQIAVDGKDLAVQVTDSALEFPPGAGGLATLRLTCEYRASFLGSSATKSIDFKDTNYSDRLGWREIVVQGSDVVLRDSSLPTSSQSNRLRNYPTDLLSNPLKQSEAHVHFDPVAGSAGSPSPSVQVNGVTVRPQDAFASLIATNDLSLPAILLSLLIAVTLGALHAVSPGHGKTIMAAYLVGTRGTVGQAMLLGLTVTLTHTLGVLALGVITLFASRYIVPESLYPWLSLISGVLVIAMGITLVYNRFRSRRITQHDHDYAHDHTHSHTEEAHGGHDHEHGEHEHGHSHLTPEVLEQGLTIPSLIGLGLVGGIVPSASALILLLAAISLQRIHFGIVLIIAFGLGMALVLVGVGVLLVRASDLIQRWRTPARVLPALPLLSAIVVIGAGIVVTAEALLQFGINL